MNRNKALQEWNPSSRIFTEHLLCLVLSAATDIRSDKTIPALMEVRSSRIHLNPQVTASSHPELSKLANPPLP